MSKSTQESIHKSLHTSEVDESQSTVEEIEEEDEQRNVDKDCVSFSLFHNEVHKQNEKFEVRILESSLSDIRDKDIVDSFPSRIGLNRKGEEGNSYRLVLEPKNQNSPFEMLVVECRNDESENNPKENIVVVRYDRAKFHSVMFKNNSEMEYFLKIFNGYIKAVQYQNSSIVVLPTTTRSYLKIEDDKYLGKGVTNGGISGIFSRSKLSPRSINGKSPKDWSSEMTIYWLEHFVYIGEKRLTKYNKKHFNTLKEFLKPTTNRRRSMKTLHREIFNFKRGLAIENKNLSSVFRDNKIVNALEREILPFLMPKYEDSAEKFLIQRNRKDEIDYDLLFKYNNTRKFDVSKFIVMKKRQKQFRGMNKEYLLQYLEDLDDRISWDIEACRDHLLSILLFKKGIKEVIDDLAKKFYEFEEKIYKEKYPQNEYGMRDEKELKSEEWLKFVLFPFNKEHILPKKTKKKEENNQKQQQQQQKKKQQQLVTGIQFLNYRIHQKFIGYYQFAKKNIERKDFERMKINTNNNIFPEYRTMFLNSEIRKKRIQNYLLMSMKKMTKSKIVELGTKLVLSVPKRAMLETQKILSKVEVLGELVGTPYGISHAFVLIGHAAIHWGDSSLASLRDLDYNPQHFYEMFCCDCRSPLFVSCNLILEKLSEVAEFMINANLNFHYSKYGVPIVAKFANRTNNLNCHEFSDRLCDHLGKTPFFPLIESYLRIFRKITKQYHDGKTSSTKSLRFMVFEKQLFEIIKDELKIWRKENINNQEEEQKVVKDVVPFSFNILQAKWSGEKTDLFQVFFRTHRDIDRICNFFIQKIPNFETSNPGTYQLLKAFDRSFWIRLMKLKRGNKNLDDTLFSEDQKKDLLICIQNKDKGLGCPFNKGVDEKYFNVDYKISPSDCDDPEEVEGEEED